MKKKPAEKYIEKAKLLNKEELEKTHARMSLQLQRKIDIRKPLEAAAIQLEIEADQVREWRTKWGMAHACVEMAKTSPSYQ